MGDAGEWPYQGSGHRWPMGGCVVHLFSLFTGCSRSPQGPAFLSEASEWEGSKRAGDLTILAR